jgi:hypothetical protein
MYIHLTRPDGVTLIEKIGSGVTFRRLEADGRPLHSAVLVGSPDRIQAVAGAPTAPYLASASAEVRRVELHEGRMEIECESIPGRLIELKVDSPVPPDEVNVVGGRTLDQRGSLSVPGRYHIEVHVNAETTLLEVTF